MIVMVIIRFYSVLLIVFEKLLILVLHSMLCLTYMFFYFVSLYVNSFSILFFSFFLAIGSHLRWLYEDWRCDASFNSYSHALQFLLLLFSYYIWITASNRIEFFVEYDFFDVSIRYSSDAEYNQNTFA